MKNKYLKALAVLQQLLIKLKMFDADTQDLSLTSVLLMVAIGRLALFPADAYTVAILTLALMHANAKKFSHHKRKQQSDKQADLIDKEGDRLKALEESMKSIQKSVSLSKLT